MLLNGQVSEKVYIVAIGQDWRRLVLFLQYILLCMKNGRFDVLYLLASARQNVCHCPIIWAEVW